MAKFRPVTLEDWPEVQAWIDADPGHAGKMDAGFFLTPGRCYSLYAVGDELGTVMYIRQENSGPYRMRAHIQFGPDRKRVMRAFREGFPLVADDARKRGFRSILFDSSSPALVKWMLMEFKFNCTCEAVL